MCIEKVISMKIMFDEETFKQFLRIIGFPLPKGVRCGWATNTEGKAKDFYVEVED